MAPDDRKTGRESPKAISTGTNARPKEEPIGQSAGGEPDDSSKAVEISPGEEAAIAAKILNE